VNARGQVLVDATLRSRSIFDEDPPELPPPSAPAAGAWGGGIVG